MDAGTLFRLKGNRQIYKVIESQSCANCCAYENTKLCQKMPYCYGAPMLNYKMLSSFEERAVTKSKQLIEIY